MSRTITISRKCETCYRTIKRSFNCHSENHFSINSHSNNKKRITSFKRNIHNQPEPPRDLCGDDYSVLKASSLQHRFKNWQHLRNNKLTASTFGSAIGFWPQRRVQLWLEKIGAIEPFAGNLATCWSNINEEAALERYKLITRNSVAFPQFQVLDRCEAGESDEWLAASADGVVEKLVKKVVENKVYGLPSRGVLEVKCPYFGGVKSNAYPWKRLPLYCMPQAQGLMEILDRDWMDFYVWTLNGSSLFRLYRDAEYWSTMKFALYDFWWNHVQPARAVYANSSIDNPLVELSHLKPGPRHELCSYIEFESKRLVDDSELVVREINWKRQDD
ncbi:hypothetical protein RND81_11G046200 [Saponaria officinalis]|uniref:YqaJ viral recombinase domain-containing protein n=1 Tax=Saponaria officinalis TaxID=3572 RepID=A0AAW1HGV9_SAPOF